MPMLEIDRPALVIIQKWKKYYGETLETFVDYAEAIRNVDKLFEQSLKPKVKK